MKLLYFTVLFHLYLLLPSGESAQIERVSIRFFSEEVSLPYPSDMRIAGPRQLREEDMVAYYRALEKTNYSILLQALQEYRKRFQLNDWLYYDLMRKTVGAIMGQSAGIELELTCWFLLSKEGFDTRLTYLGRNLYVYVYTPDEIFEVPMIAEGGKTFVNLTSIHQRDKSTEALYMLNFIPNRSGVPFHFYLRQLPLLKSQPKVKRFSFTYKGQVHHLQVEIDQTAAQIMQFYPFIGEQQYLEVPLSRVLAGSLLPQLEKLTENLTDIETLELLVAFTRSSFQYKEDKEYFGRSKPMIADEVFHYPYSDCEDRSALFYCLVQHLLDLPMIVVAFPDHLTIGVALDEPIGEAIRYQGRDYYICDPTGPVNSTAIGTFPTGYQKQKFEIIGRYK